MTIAKAYEMLIGAQAGRTPAPAATAVPGSTASWMSAGIYALIRRIGECARRPGSTPGTR